MYLNHYRLSQKPFQISPNPRFLWLGEKHKEALAMMEYAILNNQGFLVLTGDVGTGKTTLIKALVSNLGNDILVATIFNPRLSKLEFFEHVGTDFGFGKNFDGKLDFLQKLSYFLNSAYNENKKVLLIIDESQNLSIELLEEIRLLSNIEKEGGKLINIFFVGQDEFNDILTQKECRALRQRISITYNIQPLTESETQKYINHRLKIAGCEGEIFTKKAIKEAHSFCRGYPRLINIICDQALLTGYAKDKKRIKHSLIRECAQELRIPGEGHQSKKEKSINIGKVRIVRMGRIALYTSLLALITLAGYSLTSTGYAHSMKNFKTYYGNLLKHLELPHLILAEKQIKRPAPLTQSDILPDSAHDLSSKEASDVVDSTEGQISANESNLFVEQPSVSGPINDVEQPFSPEDLEMTIPFDYNTNEIPTEAYESLDEIAAIMLRYRHLEISVKGYTDALGRPAYNRKLSRFRANTVKSYLVAKGVNAERIHANGMGDKDPLGLNTTEEGRKANRRVEIELVTDGGE